MCCYGVMLMCTESDIVEYDRTRKDLSNTPLNMEYGNSMEYCNSSIEKST